MAQDNDGRLAEAMAALEALGDAKVRAQKARQGGSGPQFGVPTGEIRKLAKSFKVGGHGLGVELWRTGNLDARLLATLLLKPKELSASDLDRMVREADAAWVADWFNAYIVKVHSGKDALRVKWMEDKHPWAARAGWNLTAEAIGKGAEGIDVGALLDRLDREMPSAPAPTQWTMNNTLATIGIHFPEHRARAIAIGERHGLYRHWPVSKGCTSPFAPAWIAEMVRRQGG
jgi:3-methyladenine DNA glycosylase AlkD